MKKRNLVLDPCVLSILSLTALVSLGCGDPAVDIPDDPESMSQPRHPAWVRPISWMDATATWAHRRPRRRTGRRRTGSRIRYEPAE